jgi:hypothetical protein
MQAINVVPGVPNTGASRVTYFSEQDDPAIAQAFYLISGTTFDINAAALGLCTVDLFRTVDNLKIATTVSSATGLFYFYVVTGVQYYFVAYLAGSPDVAGSTINTISGTQT